MMSANRNMRFFALILVKKWIVRTSVPIDWCSLAGLAPSLTCFPSSNCWEGRKQVLFSLIKSTRTKVTKKLFTLLDLCVSSLRRGHANLLCIVPILTDDPRRESKKCYFLQSLLTSGIKCSCPVPSSWENHGSMFWTVLDCFFNVSIVFL